MNSLRNTVLLLAGALTVSNSVLAKNGADDNAIATGTYYGNSGTTGTAGTAGTSGVVVSVSASGTAGTSGTTGATGTSGIAGTNGTTGTTGASGSAGTTGTSGIAGTIGTAGTSGSTGTTGTSGSFGSANLNQKVLANFGDQLLVVPCIDVKNSFFDGHYHVAFALSGNKSGNDWSVVDAKTVPAASCGSVNDSAADLLQAIGLSSASSSGSAGTAGTSGSSGHNRKVIADFGEHLLVLPCVEVKNSFFNGYFHVVMSGDTSGNQWHVKAVNPTSASACEYNDAEDINDDQLLQANGLSSLGVLIHK